MHTCATPGGQLTWLPLRAESRGWTSYPRQDPPQSAQRAIRGRAASLTGILAGKGALLHHFVAGIRIAAAAAASPSLNQMDHSAHLCNTWRAADVAPSACRKSRLDIISAARPAPISTAGHKRQGSKSHRNIGRKGSSLTAYHLVKLSTFRECLCWHHDLASATIHASKPELTLHQQSVGCQYWVWHMCM